ncbi:MAG: helix-turn-helix domain-containing protein [Amphiplicatus sp.]
MAIEGGFAPHGSMLLHYYLPRADLRDFVRAYYLFETETATMQPLAAELGNIRCLLRGGGKFHFADGRIAPFAPTLLIGPTMGAYMLEADAGTRAFGVSIMPRGWRQLLGVSAEELTDRVVDLTALAGRAARSTGEEIANAPDLPSMAAAADRFFLFLLRERENMAAPYPTALEQWLLNPNDLDLDALVDMMDVSRRQTDRIAKQFFGASPKLLQRKYRSLRAAGRILFGGAANWADAAGPAFYDQSHFIKEFRTFIGASPRDFGRTPGALVTKVQRGRHELIIGSARPTPIL